jgi:hypothetical protein
VLGFSSAIVLAVAGAHASPSARIVYARGKGAEACPSEAELRKAVAVRLGYDPFFPTATKTVVAQVSRAPQGYRARVQIVGDDGNVRGERELATAGDDCGELITAIALAVSLALDDLDKIEPSPPDDPHPAAQPVDAPPVSERERTPSAEAPPAPAPPAAPQPPYAVMVGATLAAGVAPSPSLGIGIAGTIRSGVFAARLDARIDAPASTDISPGTVSTNAVSASIDGCLRGDSLFACAGPGFGWIFTRTTGIARPGSDSSPFFLVVARAGLDIPISTRLFVEPSIEGFTNLTRHHVDVDGARVYTMPVIGGAAAFEVGGRFP